MALGGMVNTSANNSGPSSGMPQSLYGKAPAAGSKPPFPGRMPPMTNAQQAAPHLPKPSLLPTL